MISRRALVGSGLFTVLPALPALAASETEFVEDTALVDDLELAYLAGIVRADIIEAYVEQDARDFYLAELSRALAATTSRELAYYKLFRHHDRVMMYVETIFDLRLDPVVWGKVEPYQLRRLLRHRIVFADALRCNLDPAGPRYNWFVNACDGCRQDALRRLDRVGQGDTQVWLHHL